MQSRRGGAGPSDHKAVTIDGHTIMAPVHTVSAFDSPYLAEAPDEDGRSFVLRDGKRVGRLSFPPAPKFYGLKTADGTPYSKIATLHGRDVLATTVLQTCIRYGSRKNTCQFCAIGQSLAAGRTIERKTPQQLGEVAKAAVELDCVRHMVMTTGTPPGSDRGAAILCESARGVKAVAVDLPIQLPSASRRDEDTWFARLKAAGVDALRHAPGGGHARGPRAHHARQGQGVGRALLRGLRRRRGGVRPRPGLDLYSRRPRRPPRGDPGHVAPAGSRSASIRLSCSFTPISGTPLEGHAGPTPAFMDALLQPLAAMLREARMVSSGIKAGCGRWASAVRPCRRMEGGAVLRTVSPLSFARLRGEVRNRGLGIRGRPGIAPPGLLPPRTGTVRGRMTPMRWTLTPCRSSR